MVCEWIKLVECEVSSPFMVIMNWDSYSWTNQNEKMRLLFVDGGSRRETKLEGKKVVRERKNVGFAK